MYKSTWKLLSIKIFALNRFLFVIANTWISKLLRDAGFTWRIGFALSSLCCLISQQAVWRANGQYIHCYNWTALALEKVLFFSSREINSSFCSSTPWQMFLLVFDRLIDAHPDGHQWTPPFKSLYIWVNISSLYLA